MRLLFSGLGLFLASGVALADRGDVEGSQDVPPFLRYPGFVITDYDEDNPATADFPVSRPLPVDAAHMEMVHLSGHRYVLRYEPGPDMGMPGIWQLQDYYEKLALAHGFVIEKSGAVGDVSETFADNQARGQMWVLFQPGNGAIGLTVMVSSESLVPLASRASSGPAPDAPLPPPGESPPPAPGTASAAPNADDPLYVDLVQKGRVLLPLAFLPGKPDIDPGGRDMVDRVARILLDHPGLKLIIEGHTDNTGDPDFNRLLSDERARAIRSLLVAQGVSRKRLSAIGLGGENPVAPNNTAEGRAQNRRIELVLLR